MASISQESTANQYVGEFIVLGLYALTIPPMSFWIRKNPGHTANKYMLLATKLFTVLTMLVAVLFIVRKWETDPSTWFYGLALAVQSLYMYGLFTPEKDSKRAWFQLPLFHIVSVLLIAYPIYAMGASTEPVVTGFERDAGEFCLTFLKQPEAQVHKDFIDTYNKQMGNVGRSVQLVEGFHHQGSFADNNIVCDVLVKYDDKDGGSHYEHVKYFPTHESITLVAGNLTEEEAKIPNLEKNIVTQ